MNIGPTPLSVLPFTNRTGAGGERDRTAIGGGNGDGFGPIYDRLAGDETGNSIWGSGNTSAELRASALNALEEGINLRSGDAAYRLNVTIGDDAVSFQARPVVGPASVDPLTNQAREPAKLGDVQSPVQSAVGPIVGVNENSSGPPSPMTSSTSHMPEMDGAVLTALRSQGKAQPNQQAQLSRNPRSTAAGAPAQPARHSPQSRTHGDQPRSEQTARPAATDRHVQARAQIFANVLASAREYRVTMRGVQLSQADLDRLASDIRAALHGYGLTDLPVILSGTSGDA